MIFRNSQSGFSLVETLVAITILLLVMIGPMTISSTTAKSTTFASEQVTAFFLAQEGVELVVKGRDDALLNEAGTVENLLSANMWNNFTDINAGPFRHCFSSTGCAIEVNDAGDVTVLRNCNPLSGCRLNRRTDGNGRAMFTHQTSIANLATTPFTRTVRLRVDSSDPNQVHITSVVRWRTGSLRDEQTVEVESYVLNVYGN